MNGDVTINQVEALLAESKALQMPAALEIDLGQIAEVDTFALSLIFEWLRQAIAAKVNINVVNVPDNLASLAALYGVLDLIPQPNNH